MSATLRSTVLAPVKATLHEAKETVAPSVRVLFLMFVATIPFETADLGYGRNTYSIAKIIGQLFGAVALVDARRTLKKPPGAVLLFGTYVFLLGFLGMFISPIYFGDELIPRLTQQAQLVFLLLLSFNVMRDGRSFEDALAVYGIAATAVCVLELLGIETRHIQWGAVERVSVLGANPNTHAMNLGAALVGVVALISFGRWRPRIQYILLGVVTVPLIMREMIATGSRGGLLATSTALAMLFVGGSKRSKFASVFGALLFGFALYWTVVHSETMMVRLDAAVEEGNTAGRDEIFGYAVDMFSEKPVFGWGPIENIYELGRRTGALRRDTHNLYLWMLTEVGIVGSIFFFGGLLLCLRSAIRAVTRASNPVPLALLAMLFIENLSGTEHNRKVFWLWLAFALAADPVLAVMGDEPPPEPEGGGTTPPSAASLPS